MKRKPIRFHLKNSSILVIVTTILFLFSFLSVFSLTGDILEHAVFIVVGAVIIWAFSFVSYVTLNKFSNIALFIALLLLIATLVFGSGAAGRSLFIMNRYIQTFYPIAFLVIFFMVSFLASNIKDHQAITRSEAIFLFVVLGGFCIGIALRNMSTAVLLMITGWLIMFIADVKPKYLFIFIFICLLGGVMYISVGSIKEKKATEQLAIENSKDRGSTVANRVKYWMTGESDTKGYGKQMTLAKAAVARSGLSPTGPGKGILKQSMAEGENDFIFALICEEFGFVVGSIILFLYFIFFITTVQLSNKSSGIFAKLYAVGIGFLITAQGLVHIGANLGVIPATGQTLPFISKGGVTLLVSCFAVGILLNIAKQNGNDAIEDETNADS
ncbi:MAG TPA: FtsW/RodA/SpoVE family cell cycle protein [Bacteroidales bacterium]|nr:FtsW/RodA/SpoVE family cell cycle protein [Bacteroidales bacterium]